jgi:uncharacterized protein (DUF1501 family)
MAITRRQFLRRSAITAVGLNFGSPLLERIAWGAPRRGAKTASTDRVVVTINLFGGNDGLNTVVPLGQYDRYRELRPKLGLDRDVVLPLQNAPDIGLNPGMTALASLYAAGKVAVIVGAGAPQDAEGLFDHEASQYDFQSADITHAADTTQPTGWLGRYLDSVAEGSVSPGIDFGGGSLVVSGHEREALTITSIDQFQVQPGFDSDARLAAYTDIQRIPHTASGVGERNRQVRLTAIEQSQIVRDATADYQPAVTYPDDNYLGDTLQQTAKLITADLGVRAIAVGTDGYDTHAAQNDGAGNGQLGYHDFLLNTVSEAVSAFYQDLAGHGVADRVVILTFSEFGRRPEENNDVGTDHGYGSVMFAVGNPVRGGVYGEYPSLDDDKLVLDGNLDTSVDFRQVYATVLANYLGADPSPVLGGNFDVLGFL